MQTLQSSLNQMLQQKRFVQCMSTAVRVRTAVHKSNQWSFSNYGVRRLWLPRYYYIQLTLSPSTGPSYYCQACPHYSGITADTTVIPSSPLPCSLYPELDGRCIVELRNDDASTIEYRYSTMFSQKLSSCATRVRVHFKIPTSPLHNVRRILLTVKR